MDNIEDLAKLTRHELQQRAKALGIRANQKSSELIEAIRARTMNVPVTPKTPAVSRKTLQAKGAMSGDFSPNSSPGSDARHSPFIFSEQKQALSQIAATTTSASKSPFGSVPRQINVRFPLVADSPQQEANISPVVSRPAHVASSPVVMKSFSPKVVVVEDAKIYSPQQQQQQFSSNFVARPQQRTPSAFQKTSSTSFAFDYSSSLSSSSSFHANPFSVQQLNENSTTFHNQQQQQQLKTGPDSLLFSTSNNKSEVKFAVEETPSKFNLKEAMRMERERRRSLKSQNFAVVEFERIESRSKPGQFYYWNPATQQTCWELPQGARLAGGVN